ncbi:MAG TPA: glycosyltransferase family 39 protein [Terriglobales bacterium]|nr:glycosyltransferase family 39 protein [Terriglobales bacterium]
MDETAVRQTPQSSDVISPPFSSKTGIVFSLIAVGALVRIASICFSDNAGGDAGAHLSLAAEWLQHPDHRLVFDTYPPGHFWLIAISWLVVRNVVWAGRLLSLACGIGSLVFMWKLSRLLWGYTAAVFSLTACALYSLHIGYSGTSSAEVPYLFFLLVGVYFFFAAVAEEKIHLGKMALSGISFSIAESVRYEAWIFLAALGAAEAGVWLYRRHHPLLKSSSCFLVWLLTAGAWPIVMMVYSQRAFGDAMYLVTWNHQRVIHSLASTPWSHQLLVMPVALLLSMSPWVAVAAIIGIAVSLRRALPSVFAIATLLFASIEAFEVLRGGLLATARYTITLGALLCILSGCGFEWLIQKIAPSRLRLAYLVVVTLLAVNCAILVAIAASSSRWADSVASVSPWLRYQPHIAEVGRYLRAHLRPDDAVVFDDYNAESNILSDAAGFPPVPGRRAYLAAKKNSMTALTYMNKEHPRYLVFSDRGTLRESFVITPGCRAVQRVDTSELHCVFSGQTYRIYELSYP